MAVEYSLFRVKFIRPAQARLLDLVTEDRLTATDLMLRSINERPSDEPREGYLWPPRDRGVASLLFQVTGYDPLALAGSLAVVTLVALSAADGPARRASQTDVVAALGGD